MNRKIIAFAVATAFAVPFTAQADVTLSGKIQGEYSYAEVGQDTDGESFTHDGDGAVFNGGSNKVQIGFDEKLGTGITAYGKYQVAFSTFSNSGLSKGKEAWVGLKGSAAFLRAGTITGAYKASKGYVDPWAGTSLQARGTGGGMSGSTYRCAPADEAAIKLINDAGGSVSGCSSHAQLRDSDGYAKTGKTFGGSDGFAHSSYVDDVIELGVKFGGFKARLQGVVDKTQNLDGAGLFELMYSTPQFTVFASGAYTDLSDVTNQFSLDEERRNKEDEGLGNWKIGAQAKFGTLKLGLQYEDAEMGTFTNFGDGKYYLGSVEYGMNNVALAAWVAGYTDDDLEEEDALSFALGAKYSFSKRTKAYLGYRQTDSDNDYRDEGVFSLGVLHSF